MSRLWIALCLSAAVATGCVAFDPIDEPVPDDEMSDVDPADPAPDAEDPCSCRDDACFSDWLRDAGHCDQCVVFSCDYGEVHACAICPGDLGDDSRPKGPKQSITGGDFDIDGPRPL